MRLQKYIAMCGAASRRTAEQMIAAGRVQVNDAVVMEMGVSIDPEQDTVMLDGVVLHPPRKHTYLIMYKPLGVITTLSDPQERKTIMDFIGGVPARVVPVGRLDWDSEGLLLLTDDGDLVFRATHPSHELGKTYMVRVLGSPDASQLKPIEEGVLLDGQLTAPAKVTIENRGKYETELRVEIHEGRNRQIRRMFEQIGYPVRYLCRIQIGPLTIDGLKPGQWRYLTIQEISAIDFACSNNVKK